MTRVLPVLVGGPHDGYPVPEADLFWPRLHTANGTYDRSQYVAYGKIVAVYMFRDLRVESPQAAYEAFLNAIVRQATVLPEPPTPRQSWRFVEDSGA